MTHTSYADPVRGLVLWLCFDRWLILRLCQKDSQHWPVRRTDSVWLILRLWQEDYGTQRNKPKCLVFVLSRTKKTKTQVEEPFRAQSHQHTVSSVNISQAHKSWEQGLNLNRSWHMATLMRTIPRSVLSHIQRICLFPYLKLFWSATTTSFFP